MLIFREGNPDRPRGHALLFFRDADDPQQVWGTYLVVAPIAMDLSKYIPSAFAPQLGAQLQEAVPSAYPLPPMPEKVAGGLARVEHLARLRGDDLLDGGTLRVSEPFAAMHPVADIAQQYAAACERFFASGEPELDAGGVQAIGLGAASSSSASSSSESSSAAGEIDVDNLLLQVMPDSEKVSRLTRLAGTLRYATEGGDQPLILDTVAEMERVGKHLGAKYRVAELIAAARSSGARAGELAQLYVERCYRMAEEDYAALAALEARIATLAGPPPSGAPPSA